MGRSQREGPADKKFPGIVFESGWLLEIKNRSRNDDNEDDGDDDSDAHDDTEDDGDETLVLVKEE